MKLLVCVKQVVDPESPLVINRDGTWIDETVKIACRLNSYDEYALEEALLFGERHPGTVIETVTVGPARARAAAVRCLEKGAHEAFHIVTGREPMGAMETATQIADFARDRRYDVVFCGVMSEDLMQCAVGPAIAALLSLPVAAAAMGCDIDPAAGLAHVSCELDGGLRENFRLPLPCLVTVQSGINRPRYPSLTNVLRAKGARIPVIEAKAAREVPGRRLSYPPLSIKGKVLGGTPADKAAALLRMFHEKSLL